MGFCFEYWDWDKLLKSSPKLPDFRGGQEKIFTTIPKVSIGFEGINNEHLESLWRMYTLVKGNNPKLMTELDKEMYKAIKEELKERKNK